MRALAYQIDEVNRQNSSRSSMPNSRDFRIIEQVSVYQTIKMFNQLITKDKAFYFSLSDNLIRQEMI